MGVTEILKSAPVADSFNSARSLSFKSLHAVLKMWKHCKGMFTLRVCQCECERNWTGFEST